MFGKLISNIPTEAFAGEIVDNRLNPLHLDIATTGYRIQSRTLQIPDRFGLFSPGPPRLQVHEGLFFIIIVGWICLHLTFNAFSVFLCRLFGLHTYQKLAAGWFMTMVPWLAIFWIVAIYDRRRAPGYEWGDWKLRQD